MNIKKSIGLVAHKILDWKTVVNPITRKFYPDLYSIRRLLPSFRKKNIQVYYTSPFVLSNIDATINRPRVFDFPSQYPHKQIKMVDGWIHQLKLMTNYFSGYGNIETQDTDLNLLSFIMGDKMRSYRKRRFGDN